MQKKRGHITEKLNERLRQNKKGLEQNAPEQNKQQAQALLTKMSTTLSALTSTLGQPDSLSLPAHVRLTGEDALVELKDLQKRCNLVIQDPSRDEALMDSKELATKLGHSKKIDSLMTGIYGSGR